MRTLSVMFLKASGRAYICKWYECVSFGCRSTVTSDVRKLQVYEGRLSFKSMNSYTYTRMDRVVMRVQNGWVLCEFKIQVYEEELILCVQTNKNTRMNWALYVCNSTHTRTAKCYVCTNYQDECVISVQVTGILQSLSVRYGKLDVFETLYVICVYFWIYKFWICL